MDYYHVVLTRSRAHARSLSPCLRDCCLAMLGSEPWGGPCTTKANAHAGCLRIIIMWFLPALALMLTLSSRITDSRCSSVIPVGDPCTTKANRLSREPVLFYSIHSLGRARLAME
ncbi:MAG: hypothetical protein U0X39_10895 [Bacteroidales bacterium]